MDLKKSLAAFIKAKKIMPGGVNSPVRSFLNIDFNPLFISHAYGSKVFDIDDNEYIDYVGSWGTMILGHAHPRIVAKLKEIVECGTSFGAPTELETQLAELIQKFFPSMEVMRMVNSGTEATMSAIRVARGFTKRDKIIKFIGCYHGHSDGLLVNAGSGAATFGVPSSLGVTKATANDTFVLPYNSLNEVENVFDKYGNKIAAIIVEPIAGNMGLILPEKNFLDGLREITERSGALLIFDEVMCGFRAALEGAQGKYKIIPDLTCLGKVIGGGLPCAVYGGREEIMRNVSPDGKVYQAGTLSGNPLAMTTGIETLKILLEDKNFMDRITAKTSKLVNGLQNIAKSLNVKIQTPQVGSMFSVFFNDKKVSNYDQAVDSDQAQFRMFFISMLQQGIYLAPSQFETLFMSDAHTEEDISRTLEAAQNAFRRI